PNDAGRAFVADDERILDVTAPGAFEYVQGVYERAAGEWGIDAVVGLVGLRALTMVEKYTDPEATPITAYRAALDAVRAGTSPRTFVTGVPPLALAAGFTQGAQWGRVTAPCWQSGRHDGVWGCVESVTNAARRYHFAPYVWTPEHGPAWFGRSDALDQWELPEAPPLTSGQSLAWLTVLAMSGSAITFGDSVDALTPDDLSVLRRLLPGPGVRARPLNVFSDDPPRVWSMPIDHDIGDWHVLALCNWGDKAQAVTVAFGELGLRPNRQYAIYDFWQDQYFGTAVDRLTISVPPGDVRVIGLRPTSKRPMFLSTDSHYTMGATDFTALTWDSSARTLTGTFDAVADTVYNLRVLVPPPYKVRQVTATCGTPEVEQAEAVLRIKVHAAQTGPVTWAAAF
ncbi:MAG: hypothetical protein GY851_30925, partial [bacterium]|nr:hypothetical protein [bacterium]